MDGEKRGQRTGMHFHFDYVCSFLAVFKERHRTAHTPHTLAQQPEQWRRPFPGERFGRSDRAHSDDSVEAIEKRSGSESSLVMSSSVNLHIYQLYMLH